MLFRSGYRKAVAPVQRRPEVQGRAQGGQRDPALLTQKTAPTIGLHKAVDVPHQGRCARYRVPALAMVQGLRQIECVARRGEPRTYPFGKVLKNLGQAMAQSGSVPDKDSIDKSLKTLDSEFKNMKKDFKKTFKLKLTKKDGKWLVLAIEKGNIDLADALTGGMLSLTVPY